MRIIAGQFRGMALAAVGKGDAAAHLRPTSDRVRESLFSALLSAGAPLEDARVLDLFAGTGALGLEALSRGAAHVTFVDDGVKAGQLVRENIDKTRSRERTKLIKRDATRLGSADAPCDLVFLDPPYGKSLGAKALLNADAQGWIAQDAWIIWEENAPQEPPSDSFTSFDQRRYGDTIVTILLKGRQP